MLISLYLTGVVGLAILGLTIVAVFDPEGKIPLDSSGNVDYASGPLAQNDSYLVLEKNSTP